MTEAKQRLQAWLADPLIDEATKEELRNLKDGPDLEDRFFRWLEFGTGGLRGKMGAGSNRMNIYTVRLVTQALADTIKLKGSAKKGVAIAYDSRHRSFEFAKASAAVLVANEIPVYVFRELAPTPLLSFAVRYFKAAGGIVITASHNPSEYNGYKAYNEHGNQLLPKDALTVSSRQAELSFKDVRVSDQPKKSPLWHWVGEEVIQAYLASLLEIAPNRGPVETLGVLYTPLHGTGARFVPEILKKAGFKNVGTVLEQMAPDGDFPTVKMPNPEDEAAFRLAFARAKKEHFDLIIATDPDADRMGIAVNHQKRWVFLNGHQIGLLLLDFILQHQSAEELEKAVAIKTIVTSEMVMPIAEKYGIEVENTLTGFKYIGALIDRLAAEGRRFIFGFEESYGYLAGSAIRDKDAVLAALLTAQAAAFYKNKGHTLVARWENLMQEHGYYKQGLAYYSFATSQEAERSQRLLSRLRQAPLEEIGGERVVKVLDYSKNECFNLLTKERTAIGLPRENVLQWLTEEKSKITLRPSGTEPKMKLYVEAVACDSDKAERRLQRLKKAFNRLVEAGLAEKTASL